MGVFQWKHGDKADLPASLDEGDHFLVTHDGGTSLSYPQIYVGPDGGGTPVQVNIPLSVGEVFFDSTVPEVTVEFQVGVWAGTYTLARQTDGKYEVGSVLSPTPSSQYEDERVVFTRPGASFFYLELTVNTSGDLVADIYDNTNTQTDPATGFRTTVALPYV